MIKQLYTTQEIRERIESNEYNAELLLIHAMINISKLEQRLSAAAEAKLSKLEESAKRAIEMLNNAAEYAANSGRESILISYDGKTKDNYDLAEDCSVVAVKLQEAIQ